MSGMFGDLNEVWKRMVWNKGHEDPPRDPAVWRRDDYGNLIRYEDYGDRESLYGWECDHYPVPAMFGGSNTVANSRPLHCKANARHGGLLGAAARRRVTLGW